MSQLTQFVNDLESVKTLYDACQRMSQRKNRQLKVEIRISRVSKEMLEHIDEELKKLAIIETEAEVVGEPVDADFSYLSCIKKALIELVTIYEPTVELELEQSES